MVAYIPRMTRTAAIIFLPRSFVSLLIKVATKTYNKRFLKKRKTIDK